MGGALRSFQGPDVGHPSTCRKGAGAPCTSSSIVSVLASQRCRMCGLRRVMEFGFCSLVGSSLRRRHSLSVGTRPDLRMSRKPSVEELERQAAELRRASRELGENISELRRKSKAEKVGLVATPWMQSVALRIFALAEFDASFPLQYLQTKGRPTEEQQLRVWLSELSPEDRRGLLSVPAGPCRALRQLTEARKFMGEASIVSWVRRQNEVKGIAPTPGAVIEHTAGIAGPSGHRRHKYKWLRRVMHRWGGRKGVFGVGDQLSPETFERKVSCGPRLMLLPACGATARGYFPGGGFAWKAVPVLGPQGDP